jgi:hypothetical protein
VFVGKYTENDAAKDTDSSTSKVAEAWHSARDDSGAREGKDSEHFEKAADWAQKTTDSGTPLFPKGKS